jgi:hypothetical protein
MASLMGRKIIFIVFAVLAGCVTAPEPEPVVIAAAQCEPCATIVHRRPPAKQRPAAVIAPAPEPATPEPVIEAAAPPEQSFDKLVGLTSTQVIQQMGEPANRTDGWFTGLWIYRVGDCNADVQFRRDRTDYNMHVSNVIADCGWGAKP